MRQAVPFAPSTRPPQTRDALRQLLAVRFFNSRLIQRWVASNRNRDAALE